MDGREQLENKPEELNYPTERTPHFHKTKWPYQPVGDYAAYVKGICWYPVCRERKSLADLYGTLIDEDHRKNLYEEFGRFLIDDRFTIFRFDIECMEKEFLEYLPPAPKTCKFCKVKRIKTENGDYFCPKMVQLFPEKKNDPDFKCHEGFEEKPRDEIELKRLLTLKKTILRQCFEMGMQIVWRGSREAAYEAYRPGVEEWLKLNYVRLLKLDTPLYNDESFLKERLSKARDEVWATEQSLKALGVPV